MTAATTTVRIYVASLSDYNAGRLHGCFIEIEEDTEASEVWDAIRAMLAASPEFRAFPAGGPAEEWAIHDSEGYHPWNHGEYESIEKMVIAGRLIADKGEVAAHWIANDPSLLEAHSSLEELRGAFEESYGGEWDSIRAYAEDLVEGMGLPGIGPVYPAVSDYGVNARERPWSDVLSDLSSYLDWDAIAEAMTEDVLTVEIGSSVHVFRSL